MAETINTKDVVKLFGGKNLYQVVAVDNDRIEPRVQVRVFYGDKKPHWVETKHVTLVNKYVRFENVDRTRHYGLRPGDIVTYQDGADVWVVDNVDSSDNNRAYIIHMTTGEIKEDAVAEWCHIVQKVEEL